MSDVEEVIRVDPPDSKHSMCFVCIVESADFALRLGSKVYGSSNTTVTHLCRGCMHELFCVVEDALDE